jgi:hypothetical protein
MELLKSVLSKVQGQLKALNQEFSSRNIKWTILESVLVEQKLKIAVQVNNKGKTTTKTFVIWLRDDQSYYFHNEGETESRVMLKDQAFKTIAMEVYGGPVLGTSLVEDDWSRKHFKHLNRVPAT